MPKIWRLVQKHLILAYLNDLHETDCVHYLAQYWAYRAASAQRVD